LVDKVPVSAHLVGGTPNTEDGQEPLERRVEVHDFYSWLKLSPELMGIISAVVDDLMGEQLEWKGSQSAIAQAQAFCKRNHFRKKLYSGLQDMVLIGDGYLGVRILTTNNAKAMISDMKRDAGIHETAWRTDLLIEKLRQKSPQVFYPRELFVLKATTIKIDYDEHGIVRSYIQKVPGNSKKVKFDPDEVIHLSMNNLGHDVYGNSPNNSCLNEIAILWYAKDYAGMFFQNDGTPDFIHVLPDENPQSANYKKFVKIIREHKKAKNKHKSMVFTGNVESKQLNQFNKDLEFPNLIDVFSQRMLMAWNMPPTRLSQIKGNYRANIESNEGYYKKINRLQLELEETLNNELFWRFGNVEIRFPRVYKRDETREADIVNRLVGKPVWSVNEGRVYLGKLPKDDPALDEVAPTFEQKNQFGKPAGRSQENKLPEETGNQFQSADEKKMFKKKRNK